MHTLRAILNKLLKKDVKWNWTVDSDLTLMHYEPNKKIYVANDASNLGLGAILFHKKKRWSIKGCTSCFEDFAPSRN